MSHEVSNKVLTIPNLITLARLLLLPVFVVLLLQYNNDVAAFLVFLLAACTDFIDGTVARRLGQVSKLGQQLDPLVDRILILSAVVAVFIAGRLPFWLLLVLVARDATMLALTAYMKFKYNRDFQVVFIGKVATVFVMAGFCGLILNLPQVPGLGLIDSAMLPGWGGEGAAIGIWFLYIGAILAWIAASIYLYRGTRPEPSAKSSSKSGSNSNNSRDPRSGSARRSNLETRLPSNTRTGSSSNPRTKKLPNQSLGKELRQNTHSTGRNSGSAKSLAKSKNSKSGYNDNPPLIFRVLNTPKKFIIAVVVTLLVLANVAFLSYDIVANMDVIHNGVKVGYVDVSGLKPEQATNIIDNEFNNKASMASVNVFASEQEKAKGVTDATEQLDKGVVDYNQPQSSSNASSWSISTSTLGVSTDGVKLATAAYGVGRNQDFLPGRIAANLFGVTVPAQLDFSQSKQENFEAMLTQSIGTPMLNASISFDGNRFVAANGVDGYVVDEEKFRKLLTDAYLSDNRDVVVPMVDRKMNIDLNTAKELATKMDKAILEPVTITYERATWQLEKAVLGSCVSTVIEKNASGRWQMLPVVDADLLKANLSQVVGNLNPGIQSVNAKFEMVDGVLQIVPGINGTGISYKGLAEQLTTVLFNNDAQDQPRTANMYIGTMEPDITTAMLREYNFPDKISEYTTEYRWATDSKITNIHIASDLINSSLIAPGGTWSFNDTAGDSTAEKGFQVGKAVYDGELVDDIGGGVCQVATTVFNAAYNAGYPIAERTNHSMYIATYPDGLDAAIAYPWADLKFTNDTSNWMVLVLSYTDESVTAALWGISPGYRVENETSEWSPGEKFKTKEVDNPEMMKGEKKVKTKGEDGKSIHVTRTVFDAQGNLIRQSTFWSVYEPVKEIVEIGTIEPPAPPAPPPTPAAPVPEAPAPAPAPTPEPAPSG